MSSKFIIAILCTSYTTATIIKECNASIPLIWCSSEHGCLHDHVFSPADYSAKIVSHYFENRRPPLMDAYFVHKLPAAMREKLWDFCKPAVLISDLLVAEAEIGYRGVSVSENSWFRRVFELTQDLSAEYRASIADIWPLDMGMQRVQTSLEKLAFVSPQLSVAFVVCHCRERLDWLVRDIGEIPLYSKLFLYEKCGEDNTEVLLDMGAFEKYTGGVILTHQKDGVTRGDECTGYLDYIKTEYDKLPDYVIFLQSDPDHHLFLSFLNTALSALRVGSYAVPFLHLNFHRHYQTTTPCMRDVERALMGSYENETLIGTYCCAQFIVSRARITENHPVSFYEAALRMVDGSIGDICSPTPPRRSSHCYVLEYLWHVVFGEPRFLPVKSEDQRLPLIFRMKYGNENAKSRWDDVEMEKNGNRIINKTNVEETV